MSSILWGPELGGTVPWCLFYTNGRNILVPFLFRAVQGPAVTKRKVSPIRLCDLGVFKNALCRWKVAVCCPAPWLQVLESFWVSLPTQKVMGWLSMPPAVKPPLVKRTQICVHLLAASVLLKQIERPRPYESYGGQLVSVRYPLTANAPGFFPLSF